MDKDIQSSSMGCNLAFGGAYAVNNGHNHTMALTTTVPTNNYDDAVHMNELPDEMLEFILTYLPPYKDLENCSLVCKRWHGVVKNLIRRSKMNLQKGLVDFRLRWEVFTQETAMATALATPRPAGTMPPPIIAGRFSHSAVRHENFMYVFGGGSSSETTFNDLWRFDLSAMRWERPFAMGAYPSPKGSASMVVWREQLVLFGGWRYPLLHPPYQSWCLFDELHFYDFATNCWTVPFLASGPPPMAGHSATVHGDRMIIFGGHQVDEEANSNSNQTWCLDLNKPRWWTPRFVSNTKPPPRYGQFQMALDEHHLLIVGGCGGPNSVYSDAWLLDMSRELWSWRSIPVKNKKYAASHMWCNPACKVDNKLVVLGPTPNMPQDFQLIKQTRLAGGNGGGANNAVGGVGAGLNQQHARNNGFERPLPNVFPPLRNGRAADAAPIDAAAAADRALLARRGVEQARVIYCPRIPGGRPENLNLPQNHNNSNNNNCPYLEMRPIVPVNNGNLSINNNNNQPRVGSLRDLREASTVGQAPIASTSAAAIMLAEAEKLNQNRPSTSAAAAAASTSSVGVPSVARINGAATVRNNNDNQALNLNSGASVPNTVPPPAIAALAQHNLNDLDAMSRLQRNLALRFRDHEPLLPKRFDEVHEGPVRMAAFSVQNRPSFLRSVSNHERIRRLEEKMNSIRSRRDAAIQQLKDTLKLKEPSPKRVKRNVLSLFVCDISAAMDPSDPHVEWLEYKNCGVLSGAPERLILSTMVPGHGELILFGGVQKETLSERSHQVSNSVHFLSAPRDIV